jgi:hypothetical protein
LNVEEKYYRRYAKQSKTRYAEAACAKTASRTFAAKSTASSADAATMTSTRPAHVYEIPPRKDHRGFTLISDALPFGRLWYGEVSDAIGYAQFYSRSHDAVICVYNEAGHVLETHKGAGHPLLEKK